MPNRCGIMFVRPALPANAATVSLKLSGEDVANYLKQFEAKMKPYVEYKERLDVESVKRLGGKEARDEIDKFIKVNTQELAPDRWLCPLSGKRFKGPEFIRKHLFYKHMDKIVEVKKECEYFNNYVADPKRPKLPEHPSNRPPAPPGGASTTGASSPAVGSSPAGGSAAAGSSMQQSYSNSPTASSSGGYHSGSSLMSNAASGGMPMGSSPSLLGSPMIGHHHMHSSSSYHRQHMGGGGGYQHGVSAYMHQADMMQQSHGAYGYGHQQSMYGQQQQQQAVMMGAYQQTHSHGQGYRGGRGGYGGAPGGGGGGYPRRG